MRTLPTIFMLLLCMHTSGGILFAQEKTITGKVHNTEGEALSLANVVLLSLPDSSYLGYTTTTRDGSYTLRYEGTGEAVLQVSHMGHLMQRQPLLLDKATQTVNFTLEVSLETLSQAVINARMLGARVRGDTISYNLQVYTDSTERVLKDILEKLPGIEIDENDKVKAQGKQVKVLIDGKEFFLDQSQMATRNIPAKMVESVDLINNYTDIGMLKGDDSQPQGISVLNIGIKESYKNRITGTLTGGAGLLSKYYGKANLFNISKNLSVATLFDANNTGEMAFSLNDYIQFQGTSRLFRNSRGSNRFSLDAIDVPISAFSEDVARKEGQTAALNMSYHHPKQKIKLNAYIIANHQEQRGEMFSRNWATTNQQQGSPTSVDALAEKTRFSFINAYLGLDYQPTNRFFISNRSMISGQDRRVNTQVSRKLQASSDSLSAEENVGNFDFKNYLLAMYRTKNGQTLTFDGYYRYNHRPANMDLLSDNMFMGLPFTPSQTGYRAIQESRQTVHEASFFMDYAYSLGSFYLKPQMGANYLQQYLNPSLFQSVNEAALLFAPEQDYANPLRYNNNDLWAGLQLQRNIGILRLALGADLHYFSTGLHDKDKNLLLKKEQWKVLPNAQLSVYFSANQHITASFNIAEEARKVVQLNESISIRNYRVLTQGKMVQTLLNPILNASLNYFFSNFRKGTTIMAGASYVKNTHPLSYDYSYYSGYSKSTVVESPHNSNIMSMFRLRQSLGRLPLDISLSMSYAAISSTSYINGEENKVAQNQLRAGLGLMSFRRGWLNGELGADASWFKNLSKLTNKSMRLLTLSPYLRLRANAGKGLTIRTSIQHDNYNGNDLLTDITNLSASIVYIPVKGSFEFELNANNILNFQKTQKITNVYAESYFMERMIQTLPGFIMAKVTYRL